MSVVALEEREPSMNQGIFGQEIMVVESLQHI